MTGDDTIGCRSALASQSIERLLSQDGGYSLPRRANLHHVRAGSSLFDVSSNNTSTARAKAVSGGPGGLTILATEIAAALSPFPCAGAVIRTTLRGLGTQPDHLQPPESGRPPGKRTSLGRREPAAASFALL